MLKLKPRKTIDDFMKLPEGTLAELIDGEIFVMEPSPRYGHQEVSANLFVAIRTYAAAKGVGKAIAAPMDVHLPSGDVVEPDLVFVSTERIGIIKDWIRGVPDLLVEIISPEGAARDRIVKRDLYARNGVPEYWIVEPRTRTIEVYRLAGGAYPAPAVFEPGDAVSTPLLPGLALPVSALFGT